MQNTIADTSSTITSDQGRLLAATMALLGVQELEHQSQEGSEIDANLIDAEGAGDLSDQDLKILAELSLPFFLAIEEKYTGDEDFNSVYAYIHIKDQQLEVHASLGYESQDSTGVHIHLGPVVSENKEEDEDLDSRICAFLRKYKVTSLSIHYSGSGDSGGTDDFELEAEIEIPTNEKDSFQDLVENRVWNNVCADFNNDGCSGEVHLEIETEHQDGAQYTLKGWHGNYENDSRTYSLSFDI